MLKTFCQRFLTLACQPVLRRVISTSSCWAVLIATSLAQGTTYGSAEPEEKSYVPSYLIIIFAVGLALLLICRTGKRTTKFRYDD